MNEDKEIEKLKNSILASRRQEDYLLPAMISNEVAIERSKVQGFPVYRLIPERAKGNIFYLYSSDYVLPIRRREWQFILSLCRLTGMAVTVPLYPLAPEKDCRDVFDHLIAAYRNFCKHREDGATIFFGNGAGGGLALSLQLLTWKEGLPDPDKIVLLSPKMDTEFFDPGIMRPNPEKEKKSHRDFWGVFEVRKRFLDVYWVKDMAGRMEYTSPIYAELTDICKDILIISGTRDPFNPYARRFSEKVTDQGIEAKFFEYKGGSADLYHSGKGRVAEHLMKILHDILLDTDSEILHLYLEEVRQRAEWSKWFPSLFRDERAMKYVSLHPRAAVSETKGRSVTNLLEAATEHAREEAVRLFLREYPDGTVVYLGCSLDTMMERVDNGRVKWFDLDSPGRLAVRSIYTRAGEREKRIERSVNDLTWMTRLPVEMDKGLLFVVKDIFSYMTREEMQEFLMKMYQHFQGCNVIFDMATPLASHMTNWVDKHSGTEYRRRKLSMRDPRREIELMSPIYNVIYVRSVLEGVRPARDWRAGLKFALWSNKRRESRKIVHIRLGYEKYQTFILDDVG